MTLISESSSESNFPKKQVLFNGTWPAEMRFLATRKWSHLEVNQDLYEITSTFMNNLAAPVERDTVTTFLALYDDNRFVDWLQAVCTRLLSDTLTESWFEDSDIIQKLRNRFDSRVQAVMTFPPDGLGFVNTGTPTVGESLHVVFIFSKI